MVKNFSWSSFAYNQYYAYMYDAIFVNLQMQVKSDLKCEHPFLRLSRMQIIPPSTSNVTLPVNVNDT